MIKPYSFSESPSVHRRNSEFLRNTSSMTLICDCMANPLRTSTDSNQPTTTSYRNQSFPKQRTNTTRNSNTGSNTATTSEPATPTAETKQQHSSYPSSSTTPTPQKEWPKPLARRSPTISRNTVSNGGDHTPSPKPSRASEHSVHHRNTRNAHSASST